MNKLLFGNGQKGFLPDCDRRLHRLEAIRPFFATMIAFGLTASGALAAVVLPLVVTWLGK